MTAVARWRSFCAALLLALVIGSASQAPSAQAAPEPVNVRFYMDVVNPKTTLCTGEQVTYTVRVIRQFTSAPPGWTEKKLPNPDAIEGVKVEAFADPTSIGTFNTANKAGIVSRTTGAIDDEPNNVEFLFTAGKKPGKGNLIFQGAVKGVPIQTGYVSFTVPVKVIACKYKVKTLLKFSTPFYTIKMISRDALMTANAAGTLTGSARIGGVYSKVIGMGGPCSLSLKVRDSQVDLTGHLEEDGGKFVATATFQPVRVSTTVACNPTGTAYNPGTVQPVTFSVTSSGGKDTQFATGEGLQGGLELKGPVSGSAEFLVRRVEK